MGRGEGGVAWRPVLFIHMLTVVSLTTDWAVGVIVACGVKKAALLLMLIFLQFFLINESH